MNAVKNALVIALLLGVGYGVFRMVNKPVETPPGIDDEIPEMGGSVSMGNVSTGGVSMGKGSSAPPFANEQAAGDSGGSMSKSAMPKSVMPKSVMPAADNAPGEAVLPYRRDASSHTGHSHGPSNPDSLAGHRDPSSPPGVAYPETGAAPYPSTQRPTGRGAEIQPAVASRKGLSAASFPQAWDSAQRLLEENNLPQAHLELSRYYGNPGLSRGDDIKLGKLLGQLAGTVIYSKSDHLLSTAYVVRQGETLRQIAREHSVTPELLAKINQLSSPQAIRTGDRLKVVQGPFHAVVDLSREEVRLMLDGRYAGRFKIVRTGLDFSDPKSTTEYRVVEQNNRDGDHWIGFGGGMGIHAETPGSGARHTMHNSIVVGDQDAAELFDILTSGSQIQILVAY